MIDKKYAMQYKMPHSVVHIIDNSAYDGPSPVVEADDPSLFATIVVSGFPIGEDNKMTTITRSDVLNVSFGTSTISNNDIKKYGQTITYPNSLIEQGAPLRMMRVVPDDASFAVASILVQWRQDPVTKSIHVRFKRNDLSNIDVSRYKKSNKLNDAIIRQLRNQKTIVEDGITWNQDVFMNIISAGRGRVYNNYTFAINQTNQGRKPANVLYEFITIDTTDDSLPERFVASLINENNQSRYDAKDSVNTIVKKRVEGSSILVPYLNENAVKSVYNTYMKALKSIIDEERLGSTAYEYLVYKLLNINTFDIIYGRYIHDGNEIDQTLPYFQVDSTDSSVIVLPETNRIVHVGQDDFNVNNPFSYDDVGALIDIFDVYQYGLLRKGDSVYVGDMYLSAGSKPTVSIVTSINQYSGLVSALRFTKFLNIDASIAGNRDKIDEWFKNATSKQISFVFNDGDSQGAGSESIKNAIKNRSLTVNDLVGRIEGDSWGLYQVTSVNPTTLAYTLYHYTEEQVIQAIDYESFIGMTKDAVANIIAQSETDPAYSKPGYLYINDHINYIDYNSTVTEIVRTVDTKHFKFGNPPTNVSITNDVVGSYYDIIHKKSSTAKPVAIYRYIVSGTQGSIYKIQYQETLPGNFYSTELGISLSSENGGIRLEGGSTGFFDEYDDGLINDIEYKWMYSALLVKAYRGLLDPSIMSPVRNPAKFLFDGGTNTIVNMAILPNKTYAVTDVINASTIFTDDEKEDVELDVSIINNIRDFDDIDVKQAMYDLMIERCYQRIPVNKRPIGPGSGLSLHLDAGVTDANTMMLISKSFAKRFDNPNASWDIGGWIDIETGLPFTYVKQIADNLIRHSKEYTVNKPYVNRYSAIRPDRYADFFPNIDATDWELNELLYNSGGNAWIKSQDGELIRKAQRTLSNADNSSALIQESNMRTLSQLVYLIQKKIDSSLFEYNDETTRKTLTDELNNMFSTWVGRLVESLEIFLEEDIDIDGGELLVCYVNVVFRGLILRVPIIVNVNRRQI